MTPEGKVKAAIKKVLDSWGIWYFMPAANGFGKQGVSDFICCWDGHMWCVEAKAPGKKGETTANQERFLEEASKNGAVAVVVDDAKQLDTIIRNYWTEKCRTK